MERLLLRCLLLLLLPAVVHAAGFRVAKLEAHLVDDQYLMNAQIDYRFSDKAIEALVNGVPLTLEVHLQLRDEDAWIWQDDLVDMRLRYRIRYLALAGVYQVLDLQTDHSQSFHTQRSAFEALGEIRAFPLIQAARLHKGSDYRMSLQSRLDIEALPLPLRPMAYLTSAWKLSSERSTRMIRP